MREVKVWPDGSWVYGDNQLPEDFSDDYMLVIVPNSVEDVENFMTSVEWKR